MNQAKRFVIRASLVTGSTLATLIGAQSLLTLNPPADVSPNTSEIMTVQQSQPVVNRAPNIAIIRRSGETTTTSNAQPIPNNLPSSQVLIQPPAPVIVAPSLIVPFQPQTRSSR